MVRAAVFIIGCPSGLIGEVPPALVSVCEGRLGDSSHIVEPFAFSLNWKPHSNSAHTATTVSLLFIKNKGQRSRRHGNKFYTHTPAACASSVIEARHPEIKSGPWVWQLGQESQMHKLSET